MPVLSGVSLRGHRAKVYAFLAALVVLVDMLRLRHAHALREHRIHVCPQNLHVYVLSAALHQLEWRQAPLGAFGQTPSGTPTFPGPVQVDQHTRCLLSPYDAP